MSADVIPFLPMSQALRARDQAPPLPVEGHLVAAALTAERLRTLAAQALLLLQHAPRDVATFDRLQQEIIGAWSDLDDHYRAFQAVSECEGQA